MASLSRRLWEAEQYERTQVLMQVVDSLNRKYGRDAVRYGLFPMTGNWKTRFGKRSPRYTTHWDELLQVGGGSTLSNPDFQTGENLKLQ